MTGFDLDGIHGSNPLGFMAALGTVAACDRSFPHDAARLSWHQSQGAWRPTLSLDRPLTREDLLAGLDAQLKTLSANPAVNLGDNLSLDCADFRQKAVLAQQSATPEQRDFADFMAAFGSESVQSKLNGKPTGKIADTAFRTMNGSGHQHFLGSIRTFIEDTKVEHLEKALFHAWRYDDPVEKHTMRWDPMDDVRYALRWQNPSGDRERKQTGSVWGANRLAIEALPLFPTAPRHTALETTGFRARRGSGTLWTWPIWEGDLTVDTIRSVLALAELQASEPNRDGLVRHGIVEVFRCKRITQGKFRNFGMAIPV
ncbi:type I-G CRISPR-associated protein, Cas3-extension family [Thiorhodococcus minor]|uniref:Type I-U CRISPR-associated protein Cas8c n=1 Tax=Thiorhodococcus minor TaxID=57489 RepID=A0A6M0JT20_9GAMM|nr:hypothetical protein [Thiorhodococcus minor]NEV60666.1 hypothetical protein [Thiorhodococcus minor]